VATRCGERTQTLLLSPQAGGLQLPKLTVASRVATRSRMQLIALLLLQPVGGVVAVVFAGQIGVVRLLISRLPLGFLLEAMGHQEARCEPD